MSKKQFDCPRCGRDKGFLINKKIKGIGPKDRPCKVCRSEIVGAKIKGNVAWNKGIPISEYTRQKLRKANLGKPSATKGIKLSEERKIKLSCSNRGITIGEFTGFSTDPDDAERVKFNKTGIRKQCFEIADYTCVVCRIRGKILNAHHLNSWSKFPSMRFELDNLVCLCNKCHKSFHSKCGTKSNTKEQFDKYLEEIKDEQMDVKIS